MIKLFVVTLELLAASIFTLSARRSWIAGFIGIGPLASLKAIVVISGLTSIIWARTLIPVLGWVRTMRISSVVVALLLASLLVIVSSIAFLWTVAEVWMSITCTIAVLFVAISTLIAIWRSIS